MKLRKRPEIPARQSLCHACRQESQAASPIRASPLRPWKWPGTQNRDCHTAPFVIYIMAARQDVKKRMPGWEIIRWISPKNYARKKKSVIL